MGITIPLQNGYNIYFLIDIIIPKINIFQIYKLFIYT